MSEKRWRILVCGLGSVGERHVRNLLSLNLGEIALFRRRGLPPRELGVELPSFQDLEQALQRFAPQVVFVTNPTSLHLETALAAGRYGCHLFIEKPLADSLNGIRQLGRLLDQQGRFAMVGYMLRFHPLFRRVKEWLEQGEEGPLGRPLFVRSSWGEDVRSWHPWEDYRSSYAVRRSMGGGPALTLSHELDLLVWMFGPARQVLSLPSFHYPLETDCEQGVDFLLRFDRQVQANVHLDYFQNPPQRSWELVCSRAQLQLNPLAGTLRCVFRDHQGVPRREEEHRVPEHWTRNDLFLEEVRYFFRCLEKGDPPSPGLWEASEVLRIALSVGSPEHVLPN